MRNDRCQNCYWRRQKHHSKSQFQSTLSVDFVHHFESSDNNSVMVWLWFASVFREKCDIVLWVDSDNFAEHMFFDLSMKIYGQVQWFFCLVLCEWTRLWLHIRSDAVKFSILFSANMLRGYLDLLIIFSAVDSKSTRRANWNCERF